jgi:hypothetical protein
LEEQFKTDKSHPVSIELILLSQDRKWAGFVKVNFKNSLIIHEENT